MSGTAGVASLQMAGAAHTLPVVIQYVLYNSREQQALSWCMEKQHTQRSSHSLQTVSTLLQPPCTHISKNIVFLSHYARHPANLPFSHQACYRCRFLDNPYAMKSFTYSLSKLPVSHLDHSPRELLRNRAASQ